MRRSTFVTLASAALAGARALPADADDGRGVPCAFEDGRLFATPRVAAGGATLRLWLDTDGFGFVYQETVDRFALPTKSDGKRTWATLPPFESAHGIPAPAGDGFLPVYARDPAEKRDPILAGFDGQLGASWFAERVWTIDYRTRRLFMRAGVSAASGGVPLEFETDDAGRRFPGREFPRLRVRVDGTVLPMSLDLAASIALTEEARKRMDAGRAPVRATSFVTATLFDAWRMHHPDWRVVVDAAPSGSVALIAVPAVTVGGVDLGTVWFSTRPGDDVFAGETVVGKLGGNAFAERKVTLDYPNARLTIG